MFRFYKLSAEKQKQNIVENYVAFAFFIFLFFCIFLLNTSFILMLYFWFLGKQEISERGWPKGLEIKVIKK